MTKPGGGRAAPPSVVVQPNILIGVCVVIILLGVVAFDNFTKGYSEGYADGVYHGSHVVELHEPMWHTIAYTCDGGMCGALYDGHFVPSWNRSTPQLGVFSLDVKI